ncbi:MAG: lamin tail domain-containing protein [Gammaproteobacteria bacterium]|nr:lamin tail domain-containing protein [Gammaproteobacteria bacterium]
MLNWLVFASTFAVALSINSHAFSATLTVNDLAANDLVITEYLANPIGVADSESEYFEIFNTTTHTLDLSGLIVRDDGSNSFTVTALSLPGHSFAVLSSGDGAALGHRVDYNYGSAMSLTNTDDEIGLYRPDDLLIQKVVYNDGDFYGAGIAHELQSVSGLTPLITTGAAAGIAFAPSTYTLLLNNFGSPGTAGNTNISLASVPLPASFWMFGSALSILGWARKKACQSARSEPEVLNHDSKTDKTDYRHIFDLEPVPARLGGFQR